MIKLNFKNVNTNKLHGELIAAGIVPLLVESTPQNDQDTNPVRPDTWVTVEDTQKAAVNAVVTAHDPTPIPVPDPDQDLYAAIEAATTLEGLKSALLGKSKPIRVKGKQL